MQLPEGTLIGQKLYALASSKPKMILTTITDPQTPIPLRPG
jgi:hypothetical protein